MVLLNDVFLLLRQCTIKFDVSRTSACVSGLWGNSVCCTCTLYNKEATMTEIVEIKQNLYMKDVERLLKRKADLVEKRAIKSAFDRHWSSVETAKVLTGAN